MKIILLQDVKKVGRKDAVVEVSDGYAKNFLIPRKLAVPYTSKSKEVLNTQKEKRAEIDELNRQNALKTQKELENVTVVFNTKVGESGKLFGAISAKEIEGNLAKNHNIQIDKRKLVDFKPLTQLGKHEVKVELYKDVIGTIKVEIKKEQ